jgi:6-phosphofructokinase 2
VRAVVDCPGKILQKIIFQRPFFIKPNLVEFQDLIRQRVTSLKSVQNQAQKILDLVPLICVSSVEGGTLMISKDRSYFGRIPPVKIRSTVGAGDSMVGAIVAQLHRNNDDLGDLLRWGLAAAAATLSVPGTSLGQAAQIESLYRKTKVDLMTSGRHPFAFQKI